MAVSGHDDDMRSESVHHGIEVSRRWIDEKLDGYTRRDRFKERAAFLVEAEPAVRAQAHVYYVDDRITSSGPSGGRWYLAH